MMAVILNSAILDSSTASVEFSHLVFLLSNSFKNALPPHWFWHKLIQSDSNSFILTQLDDGSHLEFCHFEFGHLGISHLSFSSQTHSHLPRLVPTIRTKKNNHSFIHTELDDDAAILNSAILNLAILHSAISGLSSQTHSYLPRLGPTICTKKTSLTLPSPPFAQKDLHSFILTQLDDGGHLEFCHLGFLPCWIQLLHCRIQTSCFLLSDSLKHILPLLWLWLKLIHSDSKSFIPSQLDDGGHVEFCHLGFSFWHLWNSDTLLSSLRITQNHSPSTLTLTQTNSIWLKLIHSHSTWWWQPSWILPSWIWPSWYQPS